MELRKLPDDFSRKIRNDGGMTLILIDESAGIEFENASPLGKDRLVKQFKDNFGDLNCGHQLLLAWTGKYKTDIFHLTQDDIDKHYK